MTGRDDEPLWASVLTRRLRAFIRTQPIHALQASGRLRDGFATIDLRTLAFRTLDVVIDRMGLGHGALREDIEDALAPLIRAMQPESGPDRVGEVTSVVLDYLLNERDRRTAFRERYRAPDGSGVVDRELSFRLLQEVEHPDGGVVIQATAEAINLYSGMLEVDVEDAQAAWEAVLRSQIVRGHLDRAVQTAREARLRSIEYEQMIIRRLEAARRDVTRVAWLEDVLSTLSNALTHITDRIKCEQELLDTVQTRLDQAAAQDGRRYVALCDDLSACIIRHERLHRRLLEANDVYLDEQQRQVFRPRPMLPLPELEADVLARALRLPLSAFDPLVDELLCLHTPPAPPKVLFLAGLVDTLLAPRRRQAQVIERQPIELEAIAVDPRVFDEAARRQIAGLVDRMATTPSGVTLSALLVEASRLGWTEDTRQLLVLTVLLDYDPEERSDTWVVGPTGEALDATGFHGDDVSVVAR